MKKAFLIVLGMVAGVFMVAALAGRPIYGRPVVKDNRPLLSDAVGIDHLEAPNLVVTTTGERLKVEGVVFEPWAIEAPPGDLRKFFNDSDPIRVTSDPAQPSGVAVEWKIHYFCGNSFSRRFQPKPLPRYQVADFGRGMVNRGLARDLADEGALSRVPAGVPTEAGQAGAPNSPLPPNLKSTFPVRDSED